MTDGWLVMQFLERSTITLQFHCYIIGCIVIMFQLVLKMSFGLR